MKGRFCTVVIIFTIISLLEMETNYSQTTISEPNISSIKEYSASASKSVDFGRPNLILEKSCIAPLNCNDLQDSNVEITLGLSITNRGTVATSIMEVVEGIASNVDFKIGSAKFEKSDAEIEFEVDYSNDYESANPGNATWTYKPTSGGGNAPKGFDRNVRALRWRTTKGSLETNDPKNKPSFSYSVKRH